MDIVMILVGFLLVWASVVGFSIAAEEEKAKTFILALMVFIGGVLLCTYGIYRLDCVDRLNAQNKTICSQIGGEYAGGACIKDGEIVENIGTE